ncbi:MAG: von Willebrand factor type A domain-containing protein [Hyphomicrobiaceae bacterium]
MFARPNMAIAASLAALAVGVPLAVMVHQSGREVKGTFNDVVAGLKNRVGPDDGSTYRRSTGINPQERPAAAPAAPPAQPAMREAAQDKRKPDVADAPRRADEGRAAEMPARQRLESDRMAAVPTAPPPSAVPRPIPGLVMEPPQRVGRLDDRAQQDRRPGFHVLPEEAKKQAIEQGRDKFESTPINPVKSVAQEPVSTFSVDVDTASYSFVRRSLNQGRLPQRDAVRVEEMINYFPYNYPRPETADAPFRPTVTVMPSPWNADNRLVHIAIKGYDLKTADRPRANLVLLVDISGSMMPEDRLPLLKNGFRMLVDNLAAEDTVAIVTYASGSDIRLAPTKVADKSKILAAIDSLSAGGSTHGAAGITDAYKVAEANFDKAAVNRVILATDGDWNVGITNRNELKSFIERKRETGIYLSILGVGMGNHNDQLMQTLAQNGNGVAAYIDTLNEARKVLVDEASSSLFPIAKDVKIQFEFNPARVSEYRLIGYETRALRREDFNNDKVDAGDVGSGHSVTAIYEITPVGAPRVVDDLRYAPPAAKAAAPAPDAPRTEPAPASNELGFLKLRYKLPKEEASRLLTVAITPSFEVPTVAAAPADVRFSVAVAAFGQLLKGHPFLKSYNYDDVIALANGAKGEDAFGYRAEMISLVRLAKSARP